MNENNKVIKKKTENKTRQSAQKKTLHFNNQLSFCSRCQYLIVFFLQLRDYLLVPKKKKQKEKKNNTKCFKKRQLAIFLL